MGTNLNNANNSYENSLNKKPKSNKKKFYLFKTKFNSKRQLKSYKSTSSLSASSSISSLNTNSSHHKNNHHRSKNRRIKLKFSLCGDQNCGKTSLLLSYVKNNFPRTYQPTIVDDHEGN